MRALPFFFLFAASLLPAADIGGTWLGRIATTQAAGTPDGAFQELAFQFVQKGSTIEGKFYGSYQTWPISQGKIDGDDISFAVIAIEQQGNTMTETLLRFTGHIDKDGIEITRVRESAKNAANGGAYAFKLDNTKATFRLKRLI